MTCRETWAADIALRELLEDKIGWEMPEEGRTGPPAAQETQEALISFTICDLRFTIRFFGFQIPRRRKSFVSAS
jgi:hypothetical protein